MANRNNNSNNKSSGSNEDRYFSCSPLSIALCNEASIHKYKAYWHTGAVLEISLSSFQAACLSRTRTVRSSRRVSSDAATQIFAKDSNFPSWQPKKKPLHYISSTLSRNKGQLTPLFSLLCMLREML